MRGRLVDVVASDAVLGDRPAEKTAPDSQPPTSYAQAKLADMVFRAKLRRLEFETRQGKLIEVAIVKLVRFWFPGSDELGGKKTGGELGREPSCVKT